MSLFFTMLHYMSPFWAFLNVFPGPVNSVVSFFYRKVRKANSHAKGAKTYPYFLKELYHLRPRLRISFSGHK